ncbi:MAG: hypothetical protein QOH21_2622 [Acidobacteriota bacterium]|jgi:hypothetical protein|nr:hypothetical protein [Acidobacteriota bacterium]
MNVTGSDVCVNDAELIDEVIGLGKDVHTALQQIEAGRGVTHEDAKAELRSRFGGGRASEFST